MTQRDNSPGPGGPRRLPIYRDLFLIQLALLIFLIDQFTKFLVQEFLALRESFPAEGFFRITHTFNTGSAFGLFQGQNTPLILVSFVGISILVLIYRSQPRPSNLLRFSLGLQMGGAAGNLLDRVRLGHVTDFIDIGSWPVFNLADASIVTGLVLLAWLFLRSESQRGKEATPGPDGEIAWPRQEVGSPSDGRLDLDGYAWCPICDGEMEAAPGGRRCPSCGARERVEGSTGLDSLPERDGLKPGEGPPRCPMCDGEMLEMPAGWRCASCGAGERTT